MFRGFYTLTSGMLTQQANLNTISNNMSNTSTPGYKRDTLATTTFGEVLISRTGNLDKDGTAQLGPASYIRVPDETVVDFEQGSMDQTGRVLDFALTSDGFFEIQTPDGQSVYTRNGSFSLDNEGYLYLQHVGRVMGQDGPLQLGTDKFSVTSQGAIRLDNGADAGTLRTVNFVDYAQLQKTGEGVFINENAANLQAAQPSVAWKSLERSNVQAMDEMVSMMTSQRALQSASQILKLYDQLMSKAANDIGRI